MGADGHQHDEHTAQSIDAAHDPKSNTIKDGRAHLGVVVARVRVRVNVAEADDSVVQQLECIVACQVALDSPGGGAEICRRVRKSQGWNELGINLFILESFPKLLY